MSEMNVSNVASTYGAYQSSATQKDTAAKTTEKKDTTDATASAVYEKTEETQKSNIYRVNQMSAEDRSALVQKLKEDQANRKSQLTDLVMQMMKGQTTAYAKANPGESAMWRFLADGNFTVDAATKAQAQQDISEDGYWGVKQTSQRLFDFASALAGDDVDKMKEMQEAMMKGFNMATSTWGKELPSISQQTIDAANKLFDDYYASKGVGTAEA